MYKTQFSSKVSKNSIFKFRLLQLSSIGLFEIVEIVKKLMQMYDRTFL